MVAASTLVYRKPFITNDAYKKGSLSQRYPIAQIYDTGSIQSGHRFSFLLVFLGQFEKKKKPATPFSMRGP